MSILDRLVATFSQRALESAVDAMKSFDSYERIDIVIGSCTIGEVSVALRIMQEKHDAYRNMIGKWPKQEKL